MRSMSSPQKAFSRGSSILSALLLFALGGSAALATDLLPAGSDLSQLAAPAPATQEAAPTSVTDSLGGIVWKDQIVRYACLQRVDIKSDILKLTQTCQPGFTYEARESRGTIEVRPTTQWQCPTGAPDSPKSCASIDGIQHDPVKGCVPKAYPNPPCFVRYCVGDSKDTCTNVSVDAGEDIGSAVEARRIPAISSLLNDPDINKSEVLSDLGIPASQQDALTNALTGNSSSANEALAQVNSAQQDIERQLGDLAACADPSCGSTIAGLQDETKGLQRTESYIRQAQALNEARLVAPLPPGFGTPSAESIVAPLPPGFGTPETTSVTANDTFGGPPPNTAESAGPSNSGPDENEPVPYSERSFGTLALTAAKGGPEGPDSLQELKRRWLGGNPPSGEPKNLVTVTDNGPKQAGAVGDPAQFPSGIISPNIPRSGSADLAGTPDSPSRLTSLFGLTPTKPPTEQEYPTVNRENKVNFPGLLVNRPEKGDFLGVAPQDPSSPTSWEQVNFYPPSNLADVHGFEPPSVVDGGNSGGAPETPADVGIPNVPQTTPPPPAPPEFPPADFTPSDTDIDSSYPSSFGGARAPDSFGVSDISQPSNNSGLTQATPITDFTDFDSLHGGFAQNPDSFDTDEIAQAPNTATSPTGIGSGGDSGATEIPIGNTSPTPPPPSQQTYEIPSEFQLVRANADATLREKLRILGSYDARKALANQYFSNNFSENSTYGVYEGTAEQNARLIELVTSEQNVVSLPQAQPQYPAIEQGSFSQQELSGIGQIVVQYRGESIYDFCVNAGFSSCSSNGADRLRLIQLSGMENYTPTGRNNTEALRLLRQRFELNL